MFNAFVQTEDGISKFEGVETITSDSGTESVSIDYHDGSSDNVDGTLFGIRATEELFQAFVKPERKGPVETYERTGYLMTMPNKIVVSEGWDDEVGGRHQTGGRILRAQIT